MATFRGLRKNCIKTKRDNRACHESFVGPYLPLVVNTKKVSLSSLQECPLNSVGVVTTDGYAPLCNVVTEAEIAVN